VLSGIETEAKIGGILEVRKAHTDLEEYCGKSIYKQTTYKYF
jgi:hypothetical protein